MFPSKSINLQAAVRSWSGNRKVGKLGRLWFRYSVEEMFRRRFLDGKGRNTRCSFHCNCLILGEAARPERFALPTFWFVTRGRTLLELAGTEKNAEKINKLLQAGANHLPFPLHFILPDSAALCRILYDTFMHLLLPDYPWWKVMSALRPGTTLSAIDVLTSRRNSTGCAAHVGFRRHRETVSHVTMTCESAGHVAPEATSRRQHA